MAQKTIPSRAEAAREYTWAVEDIFSSDEAWQQTLKSAKAYTEQVASYRGRLGESAAALLAYLRLDDEISGVFTDLWEYAQRKNDEDTRVARYQDMVAQLSALTTEVSAAGAFETPEILAIPQDILDEFYAQQPELERYRRALERIRKKKDHILPEREERLLSSAAEMSQAPDQIFSVFNDADLRFPDAVDGAGENHPVTHGTFIPMMQSYDRVLRRSAYDALYGVYQQFRNTSAAVLSAQTKQLLFFAKARNYPSALHASLSRSEIPVEVYHSLIDTVHQNLTLMHRYTALRKRLLGVDELHMYDLYVPVVSGVEMEVSYEKAKDIVAEALAPMGEDYGSILQEGFRNRWIDVYENQGKRSGAYSAGARVHPLVLLNYTDTLDDVFTLAHEMGHAIHSYLSNANQPITYANYVIFVAEVASTCNEALLMEHLLKTTTDKRQRAYLLNHFLEQFRTTLYRQTMFAEFEWKISEMSQRGEGLTADALCELYRELNRQYFGPDIVVDEQIGLEWARIPHFFYNFYVYQYATGYAAAIALSRRILREGAAAVEDYLGFLKGGCSADPITLLRGAGVDMATPQPVQDALELFGQLMDELETLVNDL